MSRMPGLACGRLAAKRPRSPNSTLGGGWAVMAGSYTSGATLRTPRSVSVDPRRRRQLQRAEPGRAAAEGEPQVEGVGLGSGIGWRRLAGLGHREHPAFVAQAGLEHALQAAVVGHRDAALAGIERSVAGAEGQLMHVERAAL